MLSLTFRTTLTMALIVITYSKVQAQFRPTSPGAYPAGPVVSPYLNLGGRGNPAINYYGIVRPQFEFQQKLQSLQQGQAESAADLTEILPANLTGHRVFFNNLSHYYPNSPTAPGAGRIATNSSRINQLAGQPTSGIGSRSISSGNISRP